MSTMHTPGPWFARKDPNSLDDDDWCVGTGPENIDKVAVCSSWDARLIAAAPELLDALKDMVEIFKNVPEEAIVNYDEPAEPKTQWDYDAFYVLGRARAAIAKATGAIQ